MSALLSRIASWRLRPQDDAERADIDAAWREEGGRRLDEVLNGTAKLIDGAESHARIRLALAFAGLGAFVAWEKQDTHARRCTGSGRRHGRPHHEALRTGAVLLPRMPAPDLETLQPASFDPR